MSGHSKWSTIKRAKGAADAKRSTLFNRLSKQISIAVKEGGGSGDPALNFKLRVEIDKAKAQSLPHTTIDRAIKKGLGEGGAAIEKVVYEGYGPFGVPILIVTATDNKNRTVASIKHILSKNNGNLGEQGSVAWQFKTIGQILVERDNQIDTYSLLAIDSGAEDVIETEEGLEIKTTPESINQIKEQLQSAGANIVSSEVIMESTQPISLDESQAKKIQNLAEILEEDDDVVAIHLGIN
ncbi:MAG: YebC/PmpR family DNA-binding transcriptional regulator [Candidatus Doudnabacteria bacterium]